MFKVSGISFIISLFSLVLCFAVGMYAGYRTSVVTGYLKRAADANTIPIAISQMESFLEATTDWEREGYSNVLLAYPKHDIEFWYDNLIASTKELKELPEDASQLERSNMLMKLRETLMDEGEQGTELTVPPNYSFYPYQRLYYGWMIVSFIGALLSFLGVSTAN